MSTKRWVCNLYDGHGGIGDQFEYWLFIWYIQDHSGKIRTDAKVEAAKKLLDTINDMVKEAEEGEKL